MLVLLVAGFLAGAAATLLYLALGLPARVQALAARWLAPPPRATLRAVGFLVGLGAALLGGGFVQGTRYNTLDCAAVGRLARAFENTDLSLRAFTRVVEALGPVTIVRLPAPAAAPLAAPPPRAISFPHARAVPPAVPAPPAAPDSR